MPYGYTLKDGTMLSLNYKYALYHEENLDRHFTRRLHDESGKPFLKIGEELMLHDTGGLGLFNQWRKYNIATIFKVTGGDAEYYITDSRLIALRIADPYGESIQTAGANLFYEIAQYIRLRRHKKEQIRQFLEMNLNEIIMIKTGVSYIYFLSDFWPGKCAIPESISNKLIQILQSHEKTVETKGSGKREYKEYYYVDPLIFKKEKFYDKRNMHVQKAIKYEKKGKKDKAIKEYEKALKIFPDDDLSQKRINSLSKR